VREITLYPPSPQPSPMKGEGVFLTFYETIKVNFKKFSEISVLSINHSRNINLLMLIFITKPIAAIVETTEDPP